MRRAAHILVGLLSLVIAVALVKVGVTPRPVAALRPLPLEQQVEVSPGLAVTVHAPAIGGQTFDGVNYSQRTADGYYLVIPLDVAHRQGRSVAVLARFVTADGVVHHPVLRQVAIPAAGTHCRQAVVFLVPWSALADGHLELVEDLLASYYDPGGRAELGLTDDALEAARPTRDDVVRYPTCYDTEEVL